MRENLGALERLEAELPLFSCLEAAAAALQAHHPRPRVSRPRGLARLPSRPSELSGASTGVPRDSEQDEELAPHSCDAFEELVKSFPLTTAQTSAIRLVPPVALEGDDQLSLAASEAMSPHLGVSSDTATALAVGVAFASSQAVPWRPRQGPAEVPGYHPALAGLFDYLPRGVKECHLGRRGRSCRRPASSSASSAGPHEPGWPNVYKRFRPKSVPDAGETW